MRWGEPGLWWLVLAPVLALILFIIGHIAHRRLARRAGPLVAALTETLSLERRLFKQLLLGLGLCLVVVAALRPQFGRRPEPLRQTGIDIAVAFDISKSMLARDLHPSRLAAARAELGRLLDQLEGHRMALVPFAGVAFTQSPLTADKSAIRLYLDSLDPKHMPVGGTNLAMAINEGVKLLTGEQDRGDRTGRSQVLLLLTDGEDVAQDQGEAAREAAREAAKAGVKLYAVGVGTRLGEPIPKLNEDGTHAGYLTDQSGKPVYSQLNLPLLEELCRLSDPEHPDERKVFVLDAETGVADGLVEALEQLKRSTIETQIRHRHGEKFQYALIPALLLLLLELLLSERVARRAKAEERA